MSSWIEIGFHRTELSGAGFLNDDGQFVRHEILQNGQYTFIVFIYSIKNI